MNKIKLTKGKYTLVDDENFEYLNQFKWYLNKGYADREVQVDNKSKHILMHRLITKAPERLEVDHINMDRLDNRKSNLRLCNRSQNQMNRSKNKNNTSGYKGVYFEKRWKKNWWSKICVNGKFIYLGHFNTPQEAFETYRIAVKQYHKEFARI